ncbi:GBLP [Enterospora canceri]|uniref:GBLP n=1 Tax=Enterospora canceri TaxID=1081671 RepID=A0A1Y1S5F0_9MICR|nr:GBLP [Enterospora canceri]
MSTTTFHEKENIRVAEVPIESIRRIAANTLLIAHRNKAACIYKLSTDESEKSKIIKEYRIHRSLVSDVCYAERGNQILTVSRNVLTMIDKETKEFKKFEGHTRDIVCVAVNNSNTKIVTGSQDGTFIVWNTQGKQVAKFSAAENGHTSWVNTVSFVPGSDELVATGSEDGLVKIWDLSANTCLKTFLGGQFYDLNNAEEARNLKGNNTELAVKAVCFSNDGSLMAYGGRNSRVYIVNLSVNQTMQGFDVPGRITAIASGENQPLIAIAIPNKVLLWNIIEEKIVAEHTFSSKNEVYAYSMTFMGDELVLGLTTGELIRLDISRS